jgi:hypothetical protein
MTTLSTDIIMILWNNGLLYHMFQQWDTISLQFKALISLIQINMLFNILLNMVCLALFNIKTTKFNM